MPTLFRDNGLAFGLTLWFLVIFASTPLAAIEATGEGVTQRQALNNALKQAVEQSLGTQVEAQTLVENFMVVQEKILNHTKGYVKSYRVLEETRNESGVYRLTIEADVDEARLVDSQTALNTLMKMAAHPKVYIVGIDDDFNAVSSLSSEFDILTRSVFNIVRTEFKMDVIDVETFRLSERNSYRFTDRKNNLKRARKAGAQFLIFVQILKNKPGSEKPMTLVLESLDVAQGLSLSVEKISFSMDEWTQDAQNDPDLIVNQASSLVYGPAAKVSSAMIDHLTEETYGEGKRYELAFSRFDEKLIRFLEEDLKQISGYVRHKLTRQEKNALTLSYWSELETGALNGQILNFLKAQEIPFTHSVQNRTLRYRYKDPFFE